MEDPWGSPWAVDSPAKLELPAAPQNAHFSADHLFPRRGSRSPAASRSRSPAGFEDDEAWGGWNGGAASDGGSGKESPGWGRSPGLKPLQGAPSVRSLSPDPWKEVALKRLDTTALEDDEREPRPRRASETSGDDRAADSAISLGEEQSLQRVKELKDDVHLVVPPLDFGATDSAWDAGVAPEAPAVDAVTPAIQLEQADFSLDAGVSPPGAVREEEEHEISTAASGLVQTEEANIVPKSLEVEDQPHPIAGLEAIEDAAVASEVEILQLPAPSEAELAAESQAWQEESREKTFQPPAVGEGDSLGVPTPTSPPGTVERSPWRTSDKPALHFPIDLGLLDDLFPSTPPITAEPELVPDVIIDDTFTSASERRAWYLISRFGSLRKHNMGDDDNYVRVGWSGSQIREQTTQTVRRWMEEDSITGRVVLGRRLGGSGAVMFNWNSSAPAVEIGEFLGRHSRNSSMTVHSAVASPTTSSFGWNSSVPTSPAASRHPLAKEISQEDAREAPPPKEIKADSALQSLSLAPPPAHTARAHIPTPIHIPPTYSIHQDEDEDDWGEMMTATPTTTMSFPEEEESISKRHSVPPQSAFQFDTAVESPQVAPPKKDKTPSKRPFSWHLGQTFSKPFRRGAKTPSTPTFSSPLSQPLTPPQVDPGAATSHGHTASASVSFVQPAARPDLSAEDEETVARLLGDIPDLTYMLR